MVEESTTPHWSRSNLWEAEFDEDLLNDFSNEKHIKLTHLKVFFYYAMTTRKFNQKTTLYYLLGKILIWW
jgi:hypothetical protein